MTRTSTPRTDASVSSTPPTPQGGPTLQGQRPHFVGIGGCGMSGLAHLAKARGAQVTGSDRGESVTTQALSDAGIDVVTTQVAASVPDDATSLVISAAIPYDHPEVVEATRRGVEVVKYAQMLGRLMIGATGVAIAGTHGKSTTTSLLGHVLVSSGVDPSVIVGAHCPQLGGGWRQGGSDVLVAEACEYDRSFHSLHPTHAVVLNVEADHLDLYRDVDEIVEAFHVFAQRLPAKGSLLIQHASPHRFAITGGVKCAVETIGFEPDADWGVAITQQADAAPTVTLRHRDDVVCSWTAPMPGEHMAYNAAVAAVTAHRLGASWDAIGEAITSFTGLDRRMQRIGERDGVLVIDDYGHHPTEVETTLRALRRHHKPERLICVFQPHQHSRTRFLLQQFAVSFSQADVVIVPEIYFVRDSEAEKQAVTSADLVDALREKSVVAMHLYPFDAIVEQLNVMARPGDLVVTMGAGDVFKIARALMP